MSKLFATEAELVTEFLAQLQRGRRKNIEQVWTVYPETAGWDLLLVHSSGFQVGLEAKLSMNAKVIDQALSGQHRIWEQIGPDYRGIIVPDDKLQLHLSNICHAIGIGIVVIRPVEHGIYRYLNLPGEESYSTSWPNWLPAERCKLPDFIPDVEAGIASPVQLTDWKVKAIKLMIVLERRGYVTRADMKALKISPSRWTDGWHGFLDRAPERGGYVANSRTPDLRTQHPRNYAEIEALAETWAKDCGISFAASDAAGLFSERAA